VTRAHVTFVCLTLTAIGLSGCGRGTARVSGMVRFQGKTVTSGVVEAAGADNRLYVADITAEGTYTFADLPAGSVRFLVISPEPTNGARLTPPRKGPPTKIPERAKKEATPPRPPSDSGKWFPLPERYTTFDTSGLEAVLQAGANHHDLNLE
jgi:hypothetical protein